MFDWLLEAGRQVRNAAPLPIAYMGDQFGWLTMDGTLKALGALYIILQMAFLVWKWGIAKKEYKAQHEKTNIDI